MRVLTGFRSKIATMRNRLLTSVALIVLILCPDFSASQVHYDMMEFQTFSKSTRPARR